METPFDIPTREVSRAWGSVLLQSPRLFRRLCVFFFEKQDSVTIASLMVNNSLIKITFTLASCVTLRMSEHNARIISLGIKYDH